MGPDLRIDTAITALLTVAVLPLAALPALGIVVRRYGRLPAWPLLAALGLLASAAALAAFTVFPLPRPGQVDCAGMTMTSRWQLVPFASILPSLASAFRDGGAGLAGYAFLQTPLNVLLFAPFGFFLHQVTRWRPAAVTLAAAGTSALIEITQGTGVFGIYPCPYRQLDVDDVVLNAAGGALGALLSVAFARTALANPAPAPGTSPPGAPRRALALAVDLALVATATFAAAAAATAVLVPGHGVDAAQALVESPGVAVAIDVGAAALVVLLPSVLRRDRATPGELLLDLAPVDAEDGTAPERRRMVARWAVRWLPWALFPSLLPAVLVAELLTVIARRDGRSLSGLAAGTATATRPAIRASRIVPRDDAVAAEPEQA
ncbi:VanZ family protein [Demequina soli]|uniref:VanZ family protein n=1 Tax=Demequina soli TaxID=1638987 RepID=UPI00078146B6|nr:VanZ family protein [Demequina soli]